MKTQKDKNKENTNQNIKNDNKKENANAENKDFWNEAKENISEGAKIVGERISNYSETFMNTIKDTATEAYNYTSEFTTEAVYKAQVIIDQYRDKYEIRKLSDERDDKTAELGLHLYYSIKTNKNSIPDNYLKKKKVVQLLKEIEGIEKEIVDLNNDDNTK